MKKFGGQSKKTELEKMKVVKEYLETDLSYREVAEKHGVSKSTVVHWVQRYSRKDDLDGEKNFRG